MRQYIFKSGVVFVFATLLFSFASSSKKEQVPHRKNEKGFVILELFTSQGCSSCPPADAIMGAIAMEDNENIIPIAFHVDYWNYIGWNDPFSKPEFTKRQRIYASLLKSPNVYTPQIVINGKKELVGSRKDEINKYISSELELVVAKNISIGHIYLEKDLLKIECSLLNSELKSVINVALIKKKETTSIKKGENQGLNLTNHNIVLDFDSKVVDSNKTMNFEFKVSPNLVKSDFKVVAYLQSIETGKISSAVQKEIN